MNNEENEVAESAERETNKEQYDKYIEINNKKYKGMWDYENVKKYTENINKAKQKYKLTDIETKKNKEDKDKYKLGRTPYGIVVYNLNYDANTNFIKNGTKIIIPHFTINMNKWRDKSTLQINIKDKQLNTDIKDILKDCYDNKIILDFDREEILVIEDIPISSYHSVINPDKYNNNYKINYYAYDDDYIKKYIKNSKKGNRGAFEELNQIIDAEPKEILPKTIVEIRNEEIKHTKQVIQNKVKDVDYTNAKSYQEYCKMKLKSLEKKVWIDIEWERQKIECDGEDYCFHTII